MGRSTDQALAGLLNQFTESVKLRELLTVILARVEDGDEVLKDLALKRWKDTAKGIWLDYVGALVGMLRPGNPLDDDLVYTYKSIGDPDVASKALGSLSSPGVGGKFQSLQGLTDGTLVDDDIYLEYIDARIASVNSGSAIPDIYNYVVDTFGVDCEVDNYVGIVEVTLLGPLPTYLKYLLVNLAPVMAGINLRIKGWL